MEFIFLVTNIPPNEIILYLQLLTQNRKFPPPKFTCNSFLNSSTLRLLEFKPLLSGINTNFKLAETVIILQGDKYQ